MVLRFGGVEASGKPGGFRGVEVGVKLSLLDRSRTRSGLPDGLALTHSVERAVDAEGLGYDRFWVAEHHGVPGIASGAPAVLLAAIGAQTDTIRLGSGGVMLPNHQPLVVAEQFLMLAGLFPGRVDLGVGRSLGFTPAVRRALRRTTAAPDTFADDVTELRGYIEGTRSVTARPAVTDQVPIFVLAMGEGATVAAELGLPVVLGGPVLDRPEAADLVARYRRDFRARAGSAPHVTVALDLLVADTDAEARDLALPEVWAMVQSRRTGEFGALDPVAEIRTQLSGSVAGGSRVAAQVERRLASAMAGSRETVRGRIEQVVARTGADEILATGSTYDREALAASDVAVADLIR